MAAKKSAVKGVFGAFEDILLCAGITFAAFVLSYEKFMPQSVMSVYFPAVFALTVLAWTWFPLANGYGKRIAFSVFTVLFWFLRELLLPLKILPDVISDSAVVEFIFDLVDLTVTYPAHVLSGLFGIPELVSRLMICLYCLLLFAGGWLARLRFRPNEKAR